jgi:hypothetical protein
MKMRRLILERKHTTAQKCSDRLERPSRKTVTQRIVTRMRQQDIKSVPGKSEKIGNEFEHHNPRVRS